MSAQFAMKSTSTWQALAWEMDARISIADNDRKRAERSISMALDLVNEHELPLAAWRVHVTAACSWGMIMLGPRASISSKSHALSPKAILCVQYFFPQTMFSAVLSQIDIAHNL